MPEFIVLALFGFSLLSEGPVQVIGATSRDSEDWGLGGGGEDIKRTVSLYPGPTKMSEKVPFYLIQKYFDLAKSNLESIATSACGDEAPEALSSHRSKVK